MAPLALVVEKSEQRFSRILGKALKMGWENTVLKEAYDQAVQNGLVLPAGFSIYHPKNNDSKPDKEKTTLGEARTFRLRILLKWLSILNLT